VERTGRVRGREGKEGEEEEGEGDGEGEEQRRGGEEISHCRGVWECTESFNGSSGAWENSRTITMTGEGGGRRERANSIPVKE